AYDEPIKKLCKIRSIEDCQALESDKKEMCLNVAKSFQKGEAECEKLSGSEKGECLNVYYYGTALMTGDYSICENLVDKYNKIICKGALSGNLTECFHNSDSLKD
ncbi:MAG: hypothetical protein ACQESF_06655, partial [Nanobdellota archaeon]